MVYKTTSRPLTGVYQTGEQMARLAVDYNEDVKIFDSYSLSQFFDMAKSLTYKKDPPGIEHLSRPGATLLKSAVYRDCDDKAILIGAYLYRHGIPFRFIGVSKKPNGVLHHVLAEAIIRGDARFIDATYPHNILFQNVNYTAFKPITGWIHNG